MNCTTARLAIAAMHPDSWDKTGPEFADELAHVRSCPECQAYQARVQTTDRALSVAVQNVRMPVGLKSRILAKLEASISSSLTTSSSRTSSSHSTSTEPLITGTPFTGPPVPNAHFGESVPTQPLDVTAAPVNQVLETAEARTAHNRTAHNCGVDDSVANDKLTSNRESTPIRPVPVEVDFPVPDSDAPSHNALEQDDSQRRSLERSPGTAEVATGAESTNRSVSSREISYDPRTLNRRRVLAISGIAAAMLLATGWWLWLPTERFQFLVLELLEKTQSVELAQGHPFYQSFEPQLPSAELLIPPGLSARDAITLQSDFQSSESDPGSRRSEIGAVFTFPVSTVGPGLIGHLVVIDLKKVEIDDLNGVAQSFASAEIYYPLPHRFATRVWQNGDQLLVCYVESNDQRILESLARRYFAS